MFRHAAKVDCVVCILYFVLKSLRRMGRAQVQERLRRHRLGTVASGLLGAINIQDPDPGISSRHQDLKCGGNAFSWH